MLAISTKFSRKLKKGRKVKKDLSNIEYYSYRKKGHYKNKCPKKEQVVIIGEGLPNYNK